ncbi:YbaK/EbsC family protein [Cohnella sp. AR92]|uniref:YbaK/EbsC family protein n=1 Tax=Cohnella sp. AR92 TaxID=648716 RepID=UPI000F8E11B1|nr:YbaK/EbsC family protein [Cohnella sp. AR92]RUS43804.1 YbaK/EbsC family protein [Cohnella sp. AR92]
MSEPTAALKASAQRIQSVLSEMGYGERVVELPGSTHSAQEAAEAIGCDISRIAKTIVFRAKPTGEPVLVVASGVNRINERALAKALEKKLSKADAEFVRERTGFVIGGVAPIGHAEAIETIIDEDLLEFDEIWAAAGHPHAVFRMTPSELVAMTQGRVMRVI